MQLSLIHILVFPLLPKNQQLPYFCLSGIPKDLGAKEVQQPRAFVQVENFEDTLARCALYALSLHSAIHLKII